MEGGLLCQRLLHQLCGLFIGDFLHAGDVMVLVVGHLHADRSVLLQQVGEYADPISGFLLILLGLWQLYH